MILSFFFSAVKNHLANRYTEAIILGNKTKPAPIMTLSAINDIYAL